jgi:hypothetical protein
MAWCGARALPVAGQAHQWPSIALVHGHSPALGSPVKTWLHASARMTDAWSPAKLTRDGAKATDPPDSPATTSHPG